MNLLKLLPICCFVLLSLGAEAETIAERLANYHGKVADSVMADFGPATMQSLNQWVYSFNELKPNTVPAEATPVNPTLGAGGNGVGVGPKANTVTPPLPCELRFDLDEHRHVVQTSHHGPGCFEIVFSRTKPKN